MTLLACNIERTVSILHAHGGACAYVDVLCINIHHICVLHVHVCVVVCAFMCVSAFRLVDTNRQVHYISIHTSTKQHVHYKKFSPVTCLQLRQCVNVCTYNVVFI